MHITSLQFLRIYLSLVAMLAPWQDWPIGIPFAVLLYLRQILDQIPDLLPELNSIFKECETKGKSGEKWKWHEGELRTILEDYI